jgi:hypothetical protein
VNTNLVPFGDLDGPESIDDYVYVYNLGTGCFDWEITSTEELWLEVEPASESDTHTTCHDDQPSSEYGDYLEISVDPSCAPGGENSGTFKVRRNTGDYEWITVTFNNIS